ncbi:MAG: helix-turn-helix domain-containing protein [Bacillota bacterium]
MKSKEEIKYICRLIYETTNVPVFFLDEKGEIIYDFSSSYTPNPLYPSKHELLNSLIQNNDTNECPIYHTTNYLENFFSIIINPEDKCKGRVIVGPSKYAEVSEEIVKGLISDYQLYNEASIMISYHQSLPVLNRKKLISTSLLLYYLIYNKQLDEADVLQKKNQLERNNIDQEKAELQISKRRQDVTFHHDTLYEKLLFTAVKEGRKEDIIKHLNIPPEVGELGVLSKKSYLRSQKNLTIAGITLATRSAIEGGLHPEVAFTLSDLFIQNIEDINDVKDVNTFLEQALCTFADRVILNNQQKYSSSITTCQNYIFKHLYEDITLSHLASLVNMNPSYLSVLFKKEVGISLSEYIQQARIEEAKNLLTLTEYPLSDICTWLNFTDQSYFTKIFKKFTGVTPKKFRNTH